MPCPKLIDAGGACIVLLLEEITRIHVVLGMDSRCLFCTLFFYVRYHPLVVVVVGNGYITFFGGTPVGLDEQPETTVLLVCCDGTFMWWNPSS
jgi:hypothetical protein